MKKRSRWSATLVAVWLATAAGSALHAQVERLTLGVDVNCPSGVTE